MPQLKNSLAYPWTVLAACALFLFYNYILQVSPSVMTAELIGFFHVNGAGLGNLAAMFFYSYTITQLFAGPLLDRFSTRYLATFAIIICAIGTWFFAQSEAVSSAAIARAIVGIGAAFATVSYMRMAATWLPAKQFAFAAGLLASAAMIGSLFGQTPLAMLVHSVGWRATLKDCAFVGIILAALFFIIVRDKKKPTHSTHRPKEKLKLKDFTQVLQSKDNWILALNSGLIFAPLAVFGGLWGNPFLQTAYHLDLTDSASYVSLCFVGVAVGSPILGFLSDRLGGRLRVMAFSMALALIAIILIIYIPLPFWALGVCLFLFGFGTSSFMLGFAIGRDINRLALAATVVAMINTGDAVFSAFSEPLTGHLLDLFHHGTVHNHEHFALADYHYALAILPIYILLGFTLLWFLRHTSAKIIH